VAAAGSAPAEALNAGYHAAFLVGAVFALVAAVLGGMLLRTRTTPVSVTPESAEAAADGAAGGAVDGVSGGVSGGVAGSVASGAADHAPNTGMAAPQGGHAA